MNDKVRLIVDDTGSTVAYNPTCYPDKRPPPRPNKLACWVKFTFITFATLLILGVYFKPWIFAQIEDFRARNRQTEAQKTYKIESNDGGYLLNFGQSNSKDGSKDIFDKFFKDMKTSKPVVEKVSYRNEEFVLNSKILVGTNENFDDLVLNGRKLVFFYAPWCWFSKKVLPTFNSAARSLLNGDLIAVNCDEQEDLCESLEIDKYPRFYVYEDGELILKDLDRTIYGFRQAILAPKYYLKILSELQNKKSRAAKQENKKGKKKLPSEELDLPKQNVKSTPLPLPHYGDSVITLEIHNFSNFMTNASAEIFSSPVYLKGIPWKIYVMSQYNLCYVSTGISNRALGFFLQCNGGCKVKEWKCTASARLILHSQSPRVKNFTREYNYHEFNNTMNDWGWKNFMDFNTLTKGYIKNNKIKLSIEFESAQPIGNYKCENHDDHIDFEDD